MPMYAGVASFLRAQNLRFGVPRRMAAVQPPQNVQQSLLPLGRCRHLSSSGRTSSPAPDAASTDSHPVARTELTRTNYAQNYNRNEAIRQAFWASSPEISQQVDQVLNTCYVPPARQYPTDEATRLSLRHARRIARIRVGHEIWARRGGNARSRSGTDTFRLLRRMTQPRSRKPAMHAMRIVLPESWDFDVDSSKSVVFVESKTGLAARLRMTGDRDNAGAIILRGQSSVLAKAADELIAACRDVEIFKLGEVTSLDYSAQRVWPVIDGSEDGSSVPSDHLQNIWIHKEQREYLIDSAYEKTPRPLEWTKEAFDTYIISLVYGRLQPELAWPIYRRRVVYRHRIVDGRLAIGCRRIVDSDGVRVRMLMEAFEDPENRTYLSTPVLKIALRFMSTRGGHRASAERLLAQAETWGVPLDTDAYNILLDCYVLKRDVRYFHQMLYKMRERCFYPNARTWLLFLKLVQRDDMRRQVEAAMFDLGFFSDPGTRRSVGITMANYLAYQAFRAEQPLKAFLDQQVCRFGPEWLTVDSANAVLREFFLFHQTSATQKRYHDYRLLVDRMGQDARTLHISTLHIILEHCAQPYVRDWETALWVLDRMATASGEAAAAEREHLAPDEVTYRHIINLCMVTHSSAALGATVFYAIKARRLIDRARRSVARIVLGKDEDTFWRGGRLPRLMTRKMANTLKTTPVPSRAVAVAAIESAVLGGATTGYMPADTLADVLRSALDLDRQHEKEAEEAAEKTDTETAADGDSRTSAVTITLVDVKEEEGQQQQRRRRKLVRLEAAFDPVDMVRYRLPPGPGEGRHLESASEGEGEKQQQQQQQQQQPEGDDKVPDKKQKSSADESNQPPACTSANSNKNENENTGGGAGRTEEEDAELKRGGHPLVEYLNSLH